MNWLYRIWGNSIFAITIHKGYVIEIPDLPGCITQAEYADEALTMIEDAKKGWIEIALEQGLEIPEPAKDAIIY